MRLFRASSNAPRFGSSRWRGWEPRRALIFLSLAALVVLVLAVVRVGPSPQIDLQLDRPGIGAATRVQVTISEPHRGVGRVALELQQGEQRFPLAETNHRQRAFWAFWGSRTTSATLEAVVGASSLPGLVEGEATLMVAAQRASTWLRHPADAVVERPVPVRLRPPVVSVVSTQNYAKQGGSGVVVYRSSALPSRDGVQAGEWFSPGSALPATAGELAGTRFVLFAVPYDLGDSGALYLTVADDLGNEARVAFLDRFERQPLKNSTIRLDEGFLNKVTNEIGAATPGLGLGADPLAAYLSINGDLRRRNGEELVDLARLGEQAFLWDQPFLQQPNSQVMDSFAARRRYFYQDKEVDIQDHLGLDLASVRQAPVIAAGAGRVALAQYFGIYGNTVVLDHGYGLMTLYAHLSAIEVAVDSRVERGSRLGRTGATGLAGGDHLHFTMLVHGRPVDPIEWFDGKWITNRIAAKLGGTLSYR